MSVNTYDWGVVAMGFCIKEWDTVHDLPCAAKDVADTYRHLTDSERVLFLQDAKEVVEQAIHLLQQTAEKVAAEMTELNDH